VLFARTVCSADRTCQNAWPEMAKSSYVKSADESGHLTGFESKRDFKHIPRRESPAIGWMGERVPLGSWPLIRDLQSGNCHAFAAPASSGRKRGHPRRTRSKGSRQHGPAKSMMCLYFLLRVICSRNLHESGSVFTFRECALSSIAQHRLNY
jgi:hypothetical protein